MLNVMTPVIQLEPRSLRQLLGQYATGITVVTALDVNQRKIGMTANSFTSVSLDPPLILWNIAKSATHFEDFKQAEYFAINILNEDQYLESKHFSKSADDKFEGLDDVDEYMGIPILNKSLTTFVCRQYELHEAGDHYIIVGQIEACRRLLEFIQKNIQQKIEISDLEYASGLSKKKLNTIFKKYLKCSPNAYIRHYRLKCIYNEISQSSYKINITEIAYKWGVTHLGRFSIEYKEAFGEKSSETLKKIIER